ncbi:3-methyl-2-oxobutanoate hydroxymethyltransferase [Tabrizicola oligotrophica]|uniref:3-methyl-2-oxobutanoate hydroxymethyltransferase n=1 Tax=Tabrizicola oligotrophica TaxID=2710650 RepID=A0A6M0QWQ3_9RHOB|nr:3-methyl-2-oxobutanoate hydroxymethyltransferase [Tabrizicola oligotrophica]NEY91817.1 3-methyl-2-oxobutanoate hydroxymethyltransferase [Tabrizicola oligotrophica]
MTRTRPTVADLRAWKGKRQLTMLRVFSIDEAAAAEEAGIDVVSVPPELILHPDYRKAAPSLFSMSGLDHLSAGSREDYLRLSCKLLSAGADAMYCSAGLDTVRFLASEYIPVVGHVGLVPSRATWTGGFKAVGKTADQALALYSECQAYEVAGAFAVEIEVVPEEVATEISRRMDRLLLWSMGSGAGCDVQYLFAMDILGEHRGKMPRHSKVYRNFAAEYDRLQRERVAAFNEFRQDVERGSFPEDRYIQRMDRAELERFLSGLGA